MFIAVHLGMVVFSAKNKSDSKFIESISKLLAIQEVNVSQLISLATEYFNDTQEASTNHLFSIINAINLSLFPPITDIEIFHTNRCNLMCTYCFENKKTDDLNITKNNAVKAVKLLMHYSGELQQVKILHFGGEPLLNIESIAFTSDFALSQQKQYNKNVEFSMTTNGTMLTDEAIQIIKRYRINTLVSLDGCKLSNDKYRIDHNGNGTYDSVIAGILRLKSVQPWLGIKMTIMPDNINSLYDDVKSLYYLGVNQFVIAAASGVKWTSDDWKCYLLAKKEISNWIEHDSPKDLKILDILPSFSEKQFGCQAGRNTISVTAAGKITACSKITGINHNFPPLFLGDVTLGIYNILTRRLFNTSDALSKNFHKLKPTIPFPGCCYAENFDETGDLFEIAPSTLRNAETEWSMIDVLKIEL